MEKDLEKNIAMMREIIEDVSGIWTSYPLYSKRKSGVIKKAKLVLEFLEGSIHDKKEDKD